MENKKQFIGKKLTGLPGPIGWVLTNKHLLLKCISLVLNIKYKFWDTYILIFYYGETAYWHISQRMNVIFGYIDAEFTSARTSARFNTSLGTLQQR